MILLFLAVNGDGCVLFLEKIMKISNKLMFAGALACATVMSGLAGAPDALLFASVNVERCYTQLTNMAETAATIEQHIDDQMIIIKRGCFLEDQAIELVKGEYDRFCHEFLWNVLANAMITREYGNEFDTVKIFEAIQVRLSEEDDRFNYFCRKSALNLSNREAFLLSKELLKGNICDLALNIFETPAAEGWFNAAKTVPQIG
jgi:hypothetical protein